MEMTLQPLQNTITDLQLPKTTGNNGQKRFSYKVVESWNALPFEITQAGVNDTPTLCPQLKMITGLEKETEMNFSFLYPPFSIK